MSEALIFASTNPQYDNELFIELRVQYMKIPSSEHGENMVRTCCGHKLFWMSKAKQKRICVLLMFSSCSPHVLSLEYCWLVDAKIRASDKDLPVPLEIKEV